MIEFKKGELIGGNNDGIIDFNNDRFKLEDWSSIDLTDECWIFVIPEDDSEIGLFNAVDCGVHYIPIESEDFEEHYKLFWGSELTMLFRSHENAIEFLKDYDGPLRDLIFGFYLLYEKDNMIEEAMEGYTNLSDIDNNSNEDFHIELSDFIYSRKYDSDSVIATMKLFLIDYYRFEIAEQRMSG